MMKNHQIKEFYKDFHISNVISINIKAKSYLRHEEPKCRHKIQIKVLISGKVLQDFPTMSESNSPKDVKQAVKNNSVLPPHFFVGWDQKVPAQLVFH